MRGTHWNHSNLGEKVCSGNSCASRLGKEGVGITRRVISKGAGAVEVKKVLHVEVFQK